MASTRPKIVGGAADQKVLVLAKALLRDMEEEPDERRPNDLLEQFQQAFPDSSFSNVISCGVAGRLQRMDVRDHEYDTAMTELKVICELVVEEVL